MPGQSEVRHHQGVLLRASGQPHLCGDDGSLRHGRGSGAPPRPAESSRSCGIVASSRNDNKHVLHFCNGRGADALNPTSSTTSSNVRADSRRTIRVVIQRLHHGPACIGDNVRASKVVWVDIPRLIPVP